MIGLCARTRCGLGCEWRQAEDSACPQNTASGSTGPSGPSTGSYRLATMPSGSVACDRQNQRRIEVNLPKKPKERCRPLRLRHCATNSVWDRPQCGTSCLPSCRMRLPLQELTSGSTARTSGPRNCSADVSKKSTSGSRKSQHLRHSRTRAQPKRKQTAAFAGFFRISDRDHRWNRDCSN